MDKASSKRYPAAWIERFRQERVMTFARFMHLALYEEGLGYYRKPQVRVGKQQGTDFYTNRSLGEVFVQCLGTAVSGLLRAGPQPAKPAECTWIEFGCEPAQETLTAACDTWGFKQLLALPYDRACSLCTPAPLLQSTTPCVVFANELLDAMPFHRLMFQGDRWQELGVRYHEESGELQSCWIEPLSEVLKTLGKALPKHHTEGYCLDICPEQARWLRSLMELPWRGVFVFIDYGVSWDELLYHRPRGTARAYYRHRSEENLLLRPGEQDITAHVCWTLCQEAVAGRVRHSECVSQEAFWVQWARPVLEHLARPGFSVHKQALQALVSPQHLGRKFQVFWGYK